MSFRCVKYDFTVMKTYCLVHKQRFADFEFLPPFDGKDKDGEYSIIWRRPRDVESKPKFTIDGATRGDVGQGGLGDCWAISAMASLSGRPDLLRIVIPDLDKKVLSGPEYCGILRFRFYSFGCWTEIIIDDYLPFYYDGETVFARNPVPRRPGESREWWLSLLEKAYAKLEGGYENLDGGFTSVSLTALTGGFCDEINLAEARDDQERSSEILCQMKETWNSGGLICLETENKQYSNGIVKNHAYSVSKIVDVKGFRTLIKIRNPWGETEWTGNVLEKYSDWQRAPQFLMKEIGYRNGKDAEDDGEFVMSIEDMVKQFRVLTLCNQRQMLRAANWNINQHRSMWIVGCNDGGRMENISFPTNPQYPLTIDTTSNIRIDLEQKVEGKTCHSLGLYVFKDKNLKKKNGKIKNFVCQPVMKSRRFERRRIINIKGTLPKGSYVIVPCTFYSEVQAEFLLTISLQQETQ